MLLNICIGKQQEKTIKTMQLENSVLKEMRCHPIQFAFLDATYDNLDDSALDVVNEVVDSEAVIGVDFNEALDVDVNEAFGVDPEEDLDEDQPASIE